MSAPSSPIEIIRDHLGIPHVRAHSTWDAFYGQGFAHAQDRLWQMDFDRHRAAGRWAELVGPSGLAQDRLMRRLGLAETARADYDLAQPGTRAMLDAYAAGVNAFLAQTDRLPAEYDLLGTKPEPWRPWDGLAVYKVRHVLMGVWEGKLWRAKLAARFGVERVAQLYPAPSPGERLILPPGATYDGPVAHAIEELATVADALAFLNEDGGGSNNWVVDGRHTAYGKPLMAGDPHRAVDVPNVYYQNHVACDEFDVVGFSFPGLPAFPHFGHNDAVAWCITHVGADTQDLFVERFDPQNPSRYLFQGEWREAAIRDEVLQVRGTEPETIRVVTTHHGPVIAGDPASGYGLAMRYTATLPENPGWDCLLPMLRAQSCDELDEAVSAWVDPVNNMLSADVHGQIAYRMRGLLPMRTPVNGWFPVPGWTGQHEWTGMVPYAELPRHVNPEGGRIVTANNRVVGADYPHYIAISFAADNRARRITERLEQASALTVTDMASIHADVLSLPFCHLRPLLDQVTATTKLAADALALLKRWNGEVKAELPAPLIYNTMRNHLLEALLKPLFGPYAHEAFQTAGRGGPALVAILRQRIGAMIAAGDRTLLPAGSTWLEQVTRALESAAASLAQEHGADPNAWRWGKAHQLRPVHPLAPAFPAAAARLSPAPCAMDGDPDTVQAAGYLPATGFSVTISSTARYVFNVADWDESGWVVPHGASGHADSPHFGDQAAAWQGHQLHPMLYSWAKIEAQAESRQTITP